MCWSWRRGKQKVYIISISKVLNKQIFNWYELTMWRIPSSSVSWHWFSSRIPVNMYQPCRLDVSIIHARVLVCYCCWPCNGPLPFTFLFLVVSKLGEQATENWPCKKRILLCRDGNEARHKRCTCTHSSRASTIQLILAAPSHTNLFISRP